MTEDSTDQTLDRRRFLGLPERRAHTPHTDSPTTTIQTPPPLSSQPALKSGADNLIFYLKMHANSYSNDIGGQFLMKLIYGSAYNLRKPEAHAKGTENYDALLAFFQRYAEQGNRLRFTDYEEECLLSAYEVAVPETRLREISITNNIKALAFNRRHMLLFGGVAALGSAAFCAPALFGYVREKLDGTLARKYERIVDGTFEKAQQEGYANDASRISQELIATLRKEGPTVGDIASQVGVVMTLLVLSSQLAKIVSKGYHEYEEKAEYLIKSVHELCELHLDLTPVPPELWKHTAPRHDGTTTHQSSGKEK